MKKFLFAAVVVVLCASQSTFAQKGEKVSRMETPADVLGSVIIMKHVTMWTKGNGSQTLTISRSNGETEMLQLGAMELAESAKAHAKMSAAEKNQLPDLISQFARTGFKMTGQSTSTFTQSSGTTVIETTYTFIKY